MDPLTRERADKCWERMLHAAHRISYRRGKDAGRMVYLRWVAWFTRRTEGT